LEGLPDLFSLPKTVESKYLLLPQVQLEWTKGQQQQGDEFVQSHAMTYWFQIPVLTHWVQQQDSWSLLDVELSPHHTSEHEMAQVVE